MKPIAADHISTWHSFINELQREILPIYLKHELTFDPLCVHGRIHICRSVIFAEFMARFYRINLSADVDFYAIRVATALHDSGRRNNGIDLWEADSARNGLEYIEASSNISRGTEYAEYVARLIEKRGEMDLAGRIVHDADVLEILRPCCGHGGIKGFRREFLYFAGENDSLASGAQEASEIRETLIQEGWNWINKTEAIKYRLLKSQTFMEDLLGVLAAGKDRYPLLATLL